MLTKENNRFRPRNKRNKREKQARQSAQSRWLVHGTTATHEERLGLVDADGNPTERYAQDDS